MRMPILMLPPRGARVTWDERVSNFSFAEMRAKKAGVVVTEPWQDALGHWVIEVQEDGGEVHVVPPGRIVSWEAYDGPPTGLLAAENGAPRPAPLLVESVPLPADPCDGLVFLAKIPPRPDVPHPDESVARQEIERRLIASLGGSGRPYPPGIHELARHAAQAIWLRDERIAMLDRWLLEHNLALREEDRLAGRTPSREP